MPADASPQRVIVHMQPPAATMPALLRPVALRIAEPLFVLFFLGGAPLSPSLLTSAVNSGRDR
jgi:hypothetical protein